MSLFELQRNYHILTYILSLFTSPPIFLSTSQVLSPARVISLVRASVHYNVKNTQETGGGDPFSFITKAKSPEEASNAFPTKLTEVNPELSVTPG